MNVKYKITERYKSVGKERKFSYLNALAKIINTELKKKRGMPV